MEKAPLLIMIRGGGTAKKLEMGIRLRRKLIKKGENCGSVLYVMAEWYRIPRIKLLARVIWNEQVIVHPATGSLKEMFLEPFKLAILCIVLGIELYLRETCPVKSQ